MNKTIVYPLFCGTEQLSIILSMLGVRYKNIRSYPVGFEEIYQMYPMDFEEKKAVPAVIHETVMKLFRSYAVVGGMPNVVWTYVETHDIGLVIENQRSILEQYGLDVAQYSQGNDRIKIKAIFDSIPSQLDDKNHRFFLNHIDENGRQLRYENSFVWLSDAGVALPCYNVTLPQPPLQLNQKHSLFKLFMGDSGLLCAACMENIQFDILNGDFSINMGSILENVMAMQIKSNGFMLNYFDAKKYGEIDFVVQSGTHIKLVEIKSGADYKKHAALNNIRSVEEWKIESSYVFSSANVAVEDGIRYMPWYMIMFLKPDSIEKGLKYEIDISRLK